MRESYVSADTGNVKAQLECLGESKSCLTVVQVISKTTIFNMIFC